jgi:porin
MKNTHLLCLGGLVVTLALPAPAAPLPVSNPFAPQQTQQTQQTPSTPQQQNAAPPGQAAPATAEAQGLPVLPTEPPAPSNGQPAGLNGQALSIWHQQYLTGDWGGLRDTLLNNGVAISPVWIGELFGNTGGGIRRGDISDGLFNVALDVDLDRMTHGAVDDLLFHANMLYIYGTSLSEKYVGDFSNTSNIAAYNSVRLQELWLQKSFWEKRVSIKVGNMAVDNEFFQSSSAALFVNGTFGAFTFIASNVPNAPVYPVASPGVRVQFLPTSKFYVMAGVYGLDQYSDPAINNQNGTRFAFNRNSGVLVMSEAGYLLNQSPNDRGLQGTYRLGSWLDTGNEATFASQADSANGTGDLQSGGANYGIYGVMDQQIYAHGGQGISLFVRSGGAPTNTNFVDYYVDGGFNFTGFIPGRDSDIAGIAVARSHVSDDFSDSQVAQGSPPSTAETVLEATYKAQIAPWWSIQPDLQYILTPSGVEGSRDALVLGVRSSVAF